MSKLSKAIASGLGTGYLPVAPGTWGSAGTVGVYLLVAWATGGDSPWVAVAMAATLAAASAACVALGPFAERAWGRKDPGRVTLDEWAGQALTLIWLPLPGGAAMTDWLVAACVGFVAFRAFDIVKLPPARQCEKLPRGWGILADDLVSGVYALAVTWGVLLAVG